MRLVLFDIDGTLLRCGRQVGPLFLAALEEVFGPGLDISGYSFAGKTDGRIVLDLLTRSGRSETEVLRLLPEVRSSYLPRLERGLDVAEMTLLPGVLDLLRALEGDDGVEIGLLTGNWEGGARTKLSRFDLNRFFPFGAFADDAIDRAELVPVAMSRAGSRGGRRYRAEETVIIGDTLEDVWCGQANGVRVVGVATGTTSTDALSDAGADRVVSSLESLDTEELFA